MKMFTLFNKLYQLLKTRIAVLCDEKVKSKILVIESDDWGSIRISSKENWEKLLSEGYPVDKRPYERFDILESDEDVEELSKVLLRYKDAKGHHPVITLNYLSTNPDFEAIKNNGFRKYEFESIEETYKHYPDSHNVLELVKQGVSDGIFCVQSHGREHFNVEDWMESLRRSDQDTLIAFDLNMCGVPSKKNLNVGNRFMRAYKSSSNSNIDKIKTIVQDGLHLFENIWGFKSKTFVAPCYMWNDDIEEVLQKNGVCLIQSNRCQKISDRNSVRIHHTGEKNCLGQVYTVRNIHFEPSTEPDTKDILALIKNIKKVFKKNQIAIISCHRINFVGGIEKNNRTENLALLDAFFKKLIKEVPDIEFYSSEQMSDFLCLCKNNYE